MEIKIKQISSLEKARYNDSLDYGEIHKKSVLAGERFSYQLCVKTDCSIFASVSVDSPLADHIKLYRVQDAYMDAPVTYHNVPMEDYITHEPGPMPDILVPLRDTGCNLSLSPKVSTIWVKIDVPQDTKPGTYPVKLILTVTKHGGEPACVIHKTMTVEVVPAVMPE